MSKKGFSPIILIILILALISIAFIVYHYVKVKELVGPTTTTTFPALVDATQSKMQVVEANNLFSLDLYKRYSETKGSKDNIFFSPFSISSAIAMTYEGAKDETATEIQRVFHFSTDIQTLRLGYQSIYEEINKSDKPYLLSTANALWVQKDYQLFSDYIDRIARYYQGGVTNVDFYKAAQAVATINKWIAEQTHDRIQDILSVADISDLTRIVLTNAIYFKGEWSSKFSQRLTEDKEFTLADNSKKEVPMMQQTDHFEHAELDKASILQLPYEGDDLSMLIILPKENDMSELEKSLTYQQLTEWKSKLKRHKVEVHLPKFKIETKERMAEDLKILGMPIAFSRFGANFSGIAPINRPEDNLYISQAIHQTFIENEEEGTEAAAAATAVIMSNKIGIAPIIELPEKLYIFNANHPFIFLIEQNQTGNILFMGRVANP